MRTKLFDFSLQRRPAAGRAWGSQQML